MKQILLIPRAASQTLRGDPASGPAQIVLIFACGIAYGAVLGGYGVERPAFGWQSVYSAAKVPMLLAVSFLLGMPSFFVVNTLVGLRSDFAEAWKALIGGQTAMAVVLASLSPFTLLWYASSGSYAGAQIFNGAMFAIATLAAQILMRRRYEPLIARNPRHRTMLVFWLGIYWFVAIQMAWVLRPFIGSPNNPVQFFRAEGWGNSYLILGRGLWGALFGAELRSGSG